MVIFHGFLYVYQRLCLFPNIHVSSAPDCGLDRHPGRFTSASLSAAVQILVADLGPWMSSFQKWMDFTIVIGYSWL